MRRKSIAVLFCLVILVVGATGLALAEGISEMEPLQISDRILILAPHPDDEAIACAGIIQQALKAGAEAKIVYLTNGDNNQFAFIVYEKRLTFKKAEFIHMGEVRRQEAIRSMKLLGLDKSKLIFLGYPDFGTFTVFNKYWQVEKPFRSMLTRVSSVPYKEDFSFGEPYTGESILNSLKRILAIYKPTRIFVSHPADVNQDHKALYLFLEVALADLENKIPQPKVYPYLIHYARWPGIKHYHPELNLDPPANFAHSQINWVKYDLTAGELAQKPKSILFYKSQTNSSASYLLSFVRRNELFGDFPEIKLNRQVSLKEKSPEFFGFSELFSSSQDEPGEFAADNLIQRQGQISYAIVDNCLLMRFEKGEDINRSFRLMLYVFGYSKKTPFASMPKLRIFAGYNRLKAYDGNKKITPVGMSVTLSTQGMLLRVPLHILGEPDFILTSVKARGGKIPADATAFRKIVIE